LISAYKITGNFFPPGQSLKHDAEISVDPKLFTVHLYNEEPRRYLIEELTISDRIGDTPCIISLPDGGLVEIFDNESLDALFHTLPQKPRSRFIHTLETRWQWIGAALAAIVVSLVLLFTFGLPMLSQSIASQIPPVVSEKMTVKVIAMLDSGMVTPSGLKERTKRKYQRYFKRMTRRMAQGKDYNFRLLFRKGNAIGANALALPDGTIIVTDELIRLVSHRNEFIGVMAHEAGHVVHRHGLRMTLQSSLTGLVLVYLGGDILNSASIIAALPGILIESGYSRDFEREADKFSFTYMKENNIPSEYFATLLKKLESQQKTSGKSNLFSTHPATSERLQLLKSYEK